ncbi:kelch-like protein 38 [Elysia marginata]|uniref:Kelch-like protein 38 n=1 Tax=Elysia marginata TaxID=1093978 RepID=A0AAV4JIU4_9GAST|nr:kelch-like protein 38 [Elysia marginata]
MAEPENGKNFDTSRRICRELASLMDDPTFSDVVVVVGSSTFSCHRNILAAISGFFNAAFRTDMKEAHERRIDLKGVDEETFSMLLTCIYKGQYILTAENHLKIWAAADMLQISFLLVQCQQFFETTLTVENCIRYVTNIRHLSERSKQLALQFVCRNFQNPKVQVMIKILELEEMKFVVASDTLSTYSEDEVIESVLRWTENKPQTNDAKNVDSSIMVDKTEPSSDASSQRALALGDLLECTRYLLISSDCLHNTLSGHPLVKSDPRCEAIVRMIYQYQAEPHLGHTWCPSAGTHRHHSTLTNVLVVCKWDCSNNLYRTRFLDLRERIYKWQEVYFPQFNSRNYSGNFLFHRSKVYLIASGLNLSMYSSTDKQWKQSRVHFYNMSFVKGDSLYTYCLSGNSLEIVKYPTFSHVFDHNGFQTKTFSPVVDERIRGTTINNITSIGNTLILFLGKDKQENDLVMAFDTSRCEFRVHENMFGCVSRIVTFRVGYEAFVLQENGSLWRICLGGDSLDVRATHELSVWEEDIGLNGAVVYNNLLMVVGNFKNQTEIVEEKNVSLDRIFQSVRKIKNDYYSSYDPAKISLAVLPKTILNGQF